MYVKNIVLLMPAGVVDKLVDALMVKVVVTDNHGGLHHAVMQAYRNDGAPCLLGLVGMELLHVVVDCPQKTLLPRRTTSVCSHFMLKEDGLTVLRPGQLSTLEQYVAPHESSHHLNVFFQSESIQ